MWVQITDGGAVNLNNVALLRAHGTTGNIVIQVWNTDGTTFNTLKGIYNDVAEANEIIRKLVDAVDPETY